MIYNSGYLVTAAYRSCHRGRKLRWSAGCLAVAADESYQDDRRVPFIAVSSMDVVQIEMFRSLLLCLVVAIIASIQLNMGFSKFLDKLKGNDGQTQQPNYHPGNQQQVYQAPQMQQPFQQNFQQSGGKRMVGYFVSCLPIPNYQMLTYFRRTGKPSQSSADISSKAKSLTGESTAPNTSLPSSPRNP